ncbi:MAG: hypothetical protein HQ494_13170 [Rhodospirillales bacterium]|nr:hypothetical protein [Rhodospirillales bacterium]
MKSLIILAMGTFLAVFQPTGGQALEIETRSGGAVTVHIYPADKPKAVILMFEGAGGDFNPGGRGFVNSNYSEFVERGFTAVIMDSPDDQNDYPRTGGMHPRFRESPAHVRDIDAVIAMLRKKAPLPIWVLGISLGTKSIANYSSNRPDKIDGAIFLSSSTRPPGGFKSVKDYDYGSVRSPILTIAHKEDECPGTPPGGAREIAAAATASKDAKAIFFDGGDNSGPSPCGPSTPHTFSGIEDDVVSAIDAFIQKQSK